MIRPWNLTVHLDTASDQALYLQIADAIIVDIRSGRLKSGDALPGSRILAKQLQVNRNTVVEALNVLLNEEWLIAKERKGTFVAHHLPLQRSNRKGQLVEEIAVPKSVDRIRFDDGHPDSRLAPIVELARAYRQIFNRKAKWQMMGYTHPLGDENFRRAIAQMLNHQRGMQVLEKQICITRGSQMAMYLVAQCLFKKGDYVMVENPGYQPAWRAFEQAGAQLLPVQVDREGIRIEEVEAYLQKYGAIKALYTTPHHQYPTTVTMSRQRRQELIRLSNEKGFHLIEDDYDNEFHFGYRPILPLASYAEAKHVIYIGTMSKVVAPALRIGFLVGCEELIEQVGDLRKIIDVQGDTIMEQAVLQLIQEGTIKRHLKKATTHYKIKRDFMAQLLNEHLHGIVDFQIPDGGMAFWIVPHLAINWRNVANELALKGIRIITPDQYSLPPYTNGIRLSYGSLSEDRLTEGVVALAHALKAELSRV